ncbi:hypothetical protein Hanom_Chr00s000003g01605831 [Helianthus anomalus]
MGYTQRTRQLLKLSRTRPTTKGKSLQSFKRAQEKILNGLLVFYKKMAHHFYSSTFANTKEVTTHYVRLYHPS